MLMRENFKFLPFFLLDILVCETKLHILITKQVLAVRIQSFVEKILEIEVFLRSVRIF